MNGFKHITVSFKNFSLGEPKYLQDNIFTEAPLILSFDIKPCVLFNLILWLFLLFFYPHIMLSSFVEPLSSLRIERKNPLYTFSSVLFLFSYALRKTTYVVRGNKFSLYKILGITYELWRQSRFVIYMIQKGGIPN